MYKTHIISISALALLLCFSPHLASAVASVSIASPLDNSTISGVSITFSGTSPVANETVSLIINSVTIAKVTADANGDWSFTYNNLYDGTYTFTAHVKNSSFETLATNTISFTVVNPHTIVIISPAQDQELNTLLPARIQGQSSVASGFVQLFMDTLFTNTVSTDAHGDWQSPYPALINGPHTLFAELVTANPLEVVADATISFTNSNPVTFSSDVSFIRVVQGRIATSGSGSGPGFSYFVSGNIITLTFSPAFPSTPYVIATGHRPSGASTVTITSISTTSASIAFSFGTQQVSFQATLLQ